MDISDLNESQLQKAIKLAQILSFEDIKESISILSGFDWSLGRVLASININERSVKGQEAKQQKKSKQLHKYQEKPKVPLRKQAQQNVKNLRNKQINKSLVINIYDKKERIASREIAQTTLRGQKKSEEKLKSQQIQANKFFLSHIRQKYHPILDFTFNDFQDNLQRSFKEKKYLLVYAHIIDTQRYYDQTVQEIMIDKQVANFTNKHCVVYGMIGGSNDYQKMQYYLPQKVQPIFLLFKYNNICGKEEFISLYKPQLQDLSILGWLSVSTGIPLSKKMLEKEEKIKKQSYIYHKGKDWEYFEDEEFENYSKIKENKPLEKDTKKIVKKEQEKSRKQSLIQGSIISQDLSFIVNKINDINIKQQQDEAYQRLEKSYVRKKNISEIQHQETNEKEEELKKKQKEAGDFFSYAMGDSVEIKYRLPDGAILVQKFNPNDKVDKIFAYVDIFCRDHFEEKFNNFDLTVPFSSVVPSSARKQTIDQAFEGQKRISINVKEV